ncbi:MAG: hypothetical protein WA717_00725 [Methyloceanibacter sp.]
MSEDVIVRAATVSLTGKHAQNGVNAKNGYDLAARELFTKGYRYALPCCRPPTNISRRPSTSPPEHAADLGKTPETIRVWRSPWKTTRSPRTCAPA